MNFLRDDRGNSLISTMVGALISILLLGLIATGLTVLTNFFITIGSTNVITSAKTTVEQQFRSDITWASNIPSNTATKTNLMVTIPNRVDHKCQEVQWKINNVDGKYQLARNSKIFTETIKPQSNMPSTPGSSTGTSICGGELEHEHTETLLKDAGDKANFSYMNDTSVPLTKSGEEMVADAGTGAPLLEQKARESTRIGGVTLQTGVASTGKKASSLEVTQYAKNLEFKLLSFRAIHNEEVNLR